MCSKLAKTSSFRAVPPFSNVETGMDSPPAVYDRDFYRDLIQLDEDLSRGDVIEVSTGLDNTTMRRQLKHFCKHNLGINLDVVKYFVVKFGWD